MMKSSYPLKKEMLPMKKHSSKFLLTGFALTLAACSSDGGSNNASSAQTNNTATTETGQKLNTQTPPNSSAQTNNNGGTNGAANTASTVNPTNLIHSDLRATAQIDKFKVKPVAANLEAQVQKVVENTNKLRAEKGLAPLRYDEKLSAFAQRRAEQIVGRFSHSLPDSELLVNSEAKVGENIAAGANNADTTVLVQWRNSKGHYDNLMTPNYQTIGVGIVYVPGSRFTYYWVQLFSNDGETTGNYYFDTSPNAKQNRLAAATAKSEQALPATQWLKVDGVNISLHDVSGNGSWHQINHGNHVGTVNGYTATRFGVIKNGADLYKGFYHGNNTEYVNMPQTGSATYAGKAVISDGRNVNTNVAAHIQANFSAKQLDGALVENNNKLMDIHATIRGTSFYSQEGAPVATQGGFFGTNADEVGGVFYEESTSKRGAFAAKK